MFHQLRFHSFEEGKMTWYAAKDRCKAKGGKLVEIDSEEENTFLVLEINRKGYDDNNNTNNNNNDNNKTSSEMRVAQWRPALDF